MPDSPSRPAYASWGRRIAALVVDWLLSTLVVVGLIGLARYSEDPASSWYVLGVYFLEATVLTALTGGSFGQRLLRIRVLHTDGRTLSLLVAAARTLLICVVIPPLIFKPDSGRGLHDLWTDAAAYVHPKG